MKHLFKSKAQIDKFFKFVKEGKIKEEVAREWLENTDNLSELPKRIKGKK